MKTKGSLGKILGIMMLLCVMVGSVQAFSFQFGSYTISYGSEEVEREFVNEIPEEPDIKLVRKYDDEIALVNSWPGPTSFLKDLGYRRIGVTDTVTQQKYTVLVNEEGKIDSILEGHRNIEINIDIDGPMVEQLVEQERYNEIPQYVDIPLRAKLKLLVMKIL